MFDRLGKAWGSLLASSDPSSPLAQWASSQGLAFKSMFGGAYAIVGQWQGRNVRIECSAPSRPYVQGMELMGRVDLGLATPSSVVLMNRALKRALDRGAMDLIVSGIDTDPMLLDLLDYAIDFGQGTLFGEPRPAELR